MRGLALVCLAFGLFAAPRSATAQPTIPAPPTDSSELGSDPTFEVSTRSVSPSPEIAWASRPVGERRGLRDPVFAYEPDDGLLWAGAVFFVAFYVSGVASTLPFGLDGCCADTNVAAVAFVPFAHWAVTFAGGRTSWAALIGGSIFSILEIFATGLLLGGLFHHREVLRPGREAGDVTLGRDGVEVAF